MARPGGPRPEGPPKISMCRVFVFSVFRGQFGLEDTVTQKLSGFKKFACLMMAEERNFQGPGSNWEFFSEIEFQKTHWFGTHLDIFP